MLKLIILLFIALMSGDNVVSFETNQLDCKRFKRGVFLLKSPVDKTAWKIERLDSIQIETDLTTGIKSVRILRWLNDCEYELTIPDSKEKQGDNLDVKFRKPPIITQIVKTAKNYYVFESYREGIDKRYGDTLWIFKGQ